VSVLRYSLVLLMILVFASQFSIFLTFAEVSEDKAASDLTNAEEAVASAFEVVLDAEQSGANVSGLLVRLNEAGGFLAQANMSYSAGNFEEVAQLAHLSQSIAEEVKGEAYELKNLAQSENLRLMSFTMMGSIVGVVLVVLGSVWGWRAFRRSYYRRVLKMKPEVVSDEP